MTRNTTPHGEASIVSIETFIQATRDSGYKSTATALAELVDNALDAGAKRIEIGIEDDPVDPSRGLIVWALDDGRGMEAVTLQQALRFGGSSRFGSRHDLGRYGMGLPNSSMSQARCVRVYTWQAPGEVLRATLDLDEVASGAQTGIPEPEPSALPGWPRCEVPDHGTLVVWSRCDRLDYKRASTIARKLQAFFGRVYRYFILDGVELKVNGRPTRPIDPLFVDERSVLGGGRLYDKPLEYDIDLVRRDGEPSFAGQVTVRFSELPIDAWHGLTNAEKRRRGISKAAGVSVVRGKREIDYGWFFFGKRKENYDDWWRCEVRFEASLDEVFGITHTKQQVRPRRELLEVLGPDMEAIARALNSRVRKEHQRIQSRARARAVEECASRGEQTLPPIAPSADTGDVLGRLAATSPALQRAIEGVSDSTAQYQILEEDVGAEHFYLPASHKDRRVLLLNQSHVFYRQLYQPLCDLPGGGETLKGALQLLLMSAMRAELAAGDESERAALERFRQRWSQALAAFVKAR